MKQKINRLFLILFSLLLVSQITYSQITPNYDTVKARKYDMGKMWTFDYPPVDYLSDTYGFRPTKEWLDHVRMSALRFASYCTASFVSGDGLIMTNHHCGRESVSQIEAKGEDLHKDGFIAIKLEDERKVPGLYVDQLVEIIDITKDVHNAMESGKTNEEKVKIKEKKVKEIEKKLTEEKGMKCQVVSLYNGGEYSAYIYKRYNDVRLVFAPEDQAAFFGGDPDNFTYPRYNLDCTFFRAYDENGKPLKTENYFKWSPGGASLGEPIFVVGNPGRTNRLNTMTQLEYKRDVQYPEILKFLNLMIDFYRSEIEKDPEKAKDLNNDLFSYTNSQKVYIGMIKGLNDAYLMARKKDFEKKFRGAVESNPTLKSKYGSAWGEIDEAVKGMREIFPELSSFTFNNRLSSKLFGIAESLVNSAKSSESIGDAAIDEMYKDMQVEFENKVVEFQVSRMFKKLGPDNKYLMLLTGGKKDEKSAAGYILSNTILGSKEKVSALVKQGSSAILNSNDPIIKFVVATRDRFDELNKTADSYRQKEAYNKELIGRAVFDVYGNSVPPDATFTLRISDGVIKSYDYNGTTAPPKTTFYGYYDRYYSFNKQYPWELSQRWLNPPKEMKLETPFNFISTNDITGGNSGSAVINQYAEVIGLAFDGNIESMPGDFIYTEETPTCVSLDSEGLIEAVKNMYKVDRLASELRTGAIVK